MENKKNYVELPIKTKKNKGLFKRVLKGLMLFSGVALTAIESFPVEEVKTHEEIQQSVDLLEANNSYYSSVNTKMYSNTGKKMEKVFYTPLVLPKGTEKIKVIVDDSFNEECKNAIQDTLVEYNSVLKAANQKFSLEYCQEGVKPSVCDIVVEPCESSKYVALQIDTPLPNGMRTFNKITVNETCDDYNEFYLTFTHELLHYFGIGDLYIMDEETQSSVDSIMNVLYYPLPLNGLRANDIKYLFATLDDVTTQADVERVNSYIDYHIKKFNYANLQSEKVLEKYGKDFLTKQIQKYIPDASSIEVVDLNKELILSDQKTYYSHWKSPENADIKAIKINKGKCSYIDRSNETVLTNDYTRDFYDDYAIFSFGSKYVLFNKDGKLENIFNKTSQLGFEAYAKTIQAKAEEMIF